MFPNKLFVREKGETADENTSKRRYHARVATEKLTGSDAKNFYDDLIATKPEGQTKIQRKSRRIQVNTRTIDSSLSDKVNIFKMAECNNVEVLSKLVASGIDVNQRDSFGWTSLMCAACSGAESAVRILLGARADVTASDPGYNALYLAKKHGHAKIVKLLTHGLEPPPPTSLLVKHETTYYCELCKVTCKTSKLKHEASTVHLLTVNSLKVKTFYGIPESNKGFQMLMRHGWDREKGLGPEGSGRKFPIKATQRKDRRGVGAPRKRPETEENEGTSKRVAVNPNRHSSRLKDKDRAFEKQFRLEFS